MNTKQHICEEAHYCMCSIQGLEPNEDCPIHGHPWPPTCVICGRFMKWPKQMGYVDADERYLD